MVDLSVVKQEEIDEKEPRVGSVALGLGSNLGDRVRLLERALGELTRHVALERISDVYETEPIGVRDQPWYLNLVCTGTTRLAPFDLMEFTLGIERDLGRERGEPNEPRTMDIDILSYDDRIIDHSDLKLPHPRMSERLFVLRPLADIAPEWRHPEGGESAEELVERIEDQIVRPFSLPPTPAAPLL